MRYFLRIIIIHIFLFFSVFASNLSPYLTVKDERYLTVNSDKAYEERVSIERKILNYKGVKELSEVKIFYDSRYEKVEVLNAYTKKADGSTVEVDKTLVKDLDSPSDSGLMEFAVDKMVLIPFLSVAAGDTVHLEFIKTNSSGKDIFKTYLFSDVEKALEKTYTVEYPNNLSLRISESNFNGAIKKSVDKKSGWTRVTYSGKNFEAYIPEENMPSPQMLFPAVYISTYQDTAQFGKAVYNQYLSNLDKKDIFLDKFLEKLLYGADGDLEKVSRLKDYFSLDFMYIPENDLFKFEPRDSAKIIETSYGTPIEAYMIFTYCLNNLSIKNNLMLLGENWYSLKTSLDNGDIEAFSYPISKVEVGGEVYYIDILNEFCNLDESEFDGKMGMVLGKKLSFEKVDSKKKNSREISYSIKLEKNGSAVVDKGNHYSGGVANDIRAKYRYITEYDLKKELEKIMSSISVAAKSLGKPEIDLGGDTSFSYRYQQGNFGTVDGDFIYFDLDAKINPYEFQVAPGNRKFPFENSEDFVLKRTYKIILPKGYELLLYPKSLKYKGEVYSLERKSCIKGEVLVVEDSIKYMSDILKKDGYRKLYNANIKLAHPENTRVLLRKTVEK